METKETETNGWIKRCLGVVDNSKKLHVAGAHKQQTGKINDGRST